MQRALGEAARGVVALMPDFDALLSDFDQTAQELNRLLTARPWLTGSSGTF